MASLFIDKGVNGINGVSEGSSISLDKLDRPFLLGRDPECGQGSGLVIPASAVSRKHAQILRVNGEFFIEDLKSRNKTFVNNQLVTTRTRLHDNDKIRICDFFATFHDGSAPVREPAQEPEDIDSSSTVEAMISHSSHLLLETQPAEKLRILLEISANLSKTLQLDELLPKIVDNLFTLFKQADRGFLIQAEEGITRLVPRVIKTRRAQDETTARFSRSIVRRCLETGQAFLTDDATRDDRVQLSQSVVDFRIRSVMCVPLLRADGTSFGVIQLDTQDRSKKFTEDDLRFLWGVASQAAIAMENARLHEEGVQMAVAQERLKRDLDLAKDVQTSFLPQELPRVAGYEFFAHYHSAQEVGGDYYGFVPLPGGRLAVAVGDVAGKGVPAALLMAKLSSDARFTLLSESDPGRAISHLNDLLCPFTTQMDRFVTLIAAVLDSERHMVTLVNAGHLSPLLYRSSTGTLEEAMTKDAAGVPLGIMDGFSFESVQLPLQPGDSLILFTDGVPDAVSAMGEQFQMEGVFAAFKGAGAASPRGLGERLIRSVQQHALGQSHPHDDITLVCLGRSAR